MFHVIERYLELSSGFVHGQVSRSRHRAVVLSRLSSANVDAFPATDLRVVPPVLGMVPRRRLRDRAVRAFVLSQARRVGAEVAHAHFGYALPYASVLASRGGLPLVASLHGHDVTAWPATAPWAYPEAAPWLRAVIVPSAFLRDRVIALGVGEAKVRVIPSGVDTAFFAPTPFPEGPPTVAFVGRFVEKKGLDVLAAAWPSVVRAVPDARLRVLGDGPARNVVEALARSHEGVETVAPDVARRSEQVRDIIRSATVVTTPSRTARDGDSESMLLVNLEAQACGRAVVTTYHGGIPEYVSAGESALLVSEGDADALADAVIGLLKEPERARRMGFAGAAFARSFDAVAMAARVDDLYDELWSGSTK